MNADILRRLLTPKEKENKHHQELWNKFLNTVDENISWYPSAGEDFRDIIRINNSDKIKEKPSVYIHTDYDNTTALKLIDEMGIKGKRYKVTVNNFIELSLNPDFQQPYEYFKSDYEARISLAENPEAEIELIKEEFRQSFPNAIGLKK